jgi:hypothetical protein
MKHKRHQKDRRDKDERAHRIKDDNDDHRYFNSELSSSQKSSDYNTTVYTMKNVSQNYDDDSNHPKKLIIYIVKLNYFFLLFHT